LEEEEQTFDFHNRPKTKIPKDRNEKTSQLKAVVYALRELNDKQGPNNKCDPGTNVAEIRHDYCKEIVSLSNCKLTPRLTELRRKLDNHQNNADWVGYNTAKEEFSNLISSFVNRPRMDSIPDPNKRPKGQKSRLIIYLQSLGTKAAREFADYLEIVLDCETHKQKGEVFFNRGIGAGKWPVIRRD